MQETALPTLMTDPPQNMILLSQAGSGKTTAFLIAMLNRIDMSKNYPQALCLAPTDELAAQMGCSAAKMIRSTSIKIEYALSGSSSKFFKMILTLKRYKFIFVDFLLV